MLSKIDEAHMRLHVEIALTALQMQKAQQGYECTDEEYLDLVQQTIDDMRDALKDK